jgi:hypothetical protein
MVLVLLNKTRRLFKQLLPSLNSGWGAWVLVTLKHTLNDLIYHWLPVPLIFILSSIYSYQELNPNTHFCLLLT